MLFSKRRTLLGAATSLATLAMPATGRAAKRYLRLAHNNNTQSILHAGAEAFAKAAAELSDGGLLFEIYPNAMLGSEKEAMSALTEGTLDAVICAIGVTSAVAAEVALVELPYLFNSVATARQSFDGPLGQHCAGLLRKKSVVLAGWGELGMRHITANKPVRTPDDLKGLKLRVQLSEPTLQGFLALGAAAAPLPFSQLPDALRTGRFEAQENPIAVILASQLQKYQSHLSLTAHVYAPSMIAISGDVFDDLPAADQRIVEQAGKAGAIAMRAFGDKAELEGLASLRAAGLTVVEDVDRKAMRAAMGPAIEKLGQMFGNDAVKTIRALA